MNEKINYDDFAKLDFRVGKIVSVREHENANKLFVLDVDFGVLGKRQIVAGLRGRYSIEELEGRKAVFVFNLEPVVLRGVKSEGMILAAVSSGDKEIIFIAPERDIDEGSK